MDLGAGRQLELVLNHYRADLDVNDLGTDIDLSDKWETKLGINGQPGGDGMSAGMAFWIDDWIGENWSVGLQWLYSHADSDWGADFSAFDLSIVKAEVNADFDFNTFFLNVAYRQNDKENRWHPYIGVGVGGGIVRIDAKAKLRLVGGGPLST